MASLKMEKPVGSQSAGAPKKEPAKAPVAKQGPPKGEQKPREPRKKASFSYFFIFFPTILTKTVLRNLIKTSFGERGK